MSNITNNTASSRFSEYTLDDYSTCKATANTAPSSTNRVVAAMQATAHKVVNAFSYAAAFLSNMVLSVANLAIRAANFMHGRIFTKEAPAAKPVEIELGPKKEVLAITYLEPLNLEPLKASPQKDVLTITYVEPQTASEQLAPAVEAAPKEKAQAVVDTKKDAAKSLPPSRSRLEKGVATITDLLKNNGPDLCGYISSGLVSVQMPYLLGFSMMPPPLTSGLAIGAIAFGVAKGAQPFYAYAMDKLDF